MFPFSGFGRYIFPPPVFLLNKGSISATRYDYVTHDGEIVTVGGVPVTYPVARIFPVADTLTLTDSVAYALRQAGPAPYAVYNGTPEEGDFVLFISDKNVAYTLPEIALVENKTSSFRRMFDYVLQTNLSGQTLGTSVYTAGGSISSWLNAGLASLGLTPATTRIWQAGNTALIVLEFNAGVNPTLPLFTLRRDGAYTAGYLWHPQYGLPDSNQYYFYGSQSLFDTSILDVLNTAHPDSEIEITTLLSGAVTFFKATEESFTPNLFFDTSGTTTSDYIYNGADPPDVIYQNYRVSGKVYEDGDDLATVGYKFVIKNVDSIRLVDVKTGLSGDTANETVGEYVLGAYFGFNATQLSERYHNSTLHVFDKLELEEFPVKTTSQPWSTLGIAFNSTWSLLLVEHDVTPASSLSIADGNSVIEVPVVGSASSIGFTEDLDYTVEQMISDTYWFDGFDFITRWTGTFTTTGGATTTSDLQSWSFVPSTQWYVGFKIKFSSTYLADLTNGTLLDLGSHVVTVQGSNLRVNGQQMGTVVADEWHWIELGPVCHFDGQPMFNVTNASIGSLHFTPKMNIILDHVYVSQVQLGKVNLETVIPSVITAAQHVSVVGDDTIIGDGTNFGVLTRAADPGLKTHWVVGSGAFNHIFDSVVQPNRFRNINYQNTTATDVGLGSVDYTLEETYLTKAVSVSKIITLTISDFLSTSDSVRSYLEQQITDSVTLTDSIVVALDSLIQQAYSNVGLSDSVKVNRVINLSLSDSVAIGDKGNRTAVASASSTISFSEQLSESFRRLLTTSDILSFQDYISVALNLNQYLTDQLPLNDSVQSYVNVPYLIKSIMSLTDSVTYTMRPVQKVIDTLTFADSVARRIVPFQRVTDTLALTDVIRNNNFWTRSVADTLSLTDTVQQLFLPQQNMASLLQLTDSIGVTRELNFMISDCLSFDDYVKKMIAISVMDQLVLTDSVGSGYTSSVLTLSDALTSNIVFDSCRGTGSLMDKWFRDTITLTDSISMVGGFTLRVEDTINLRDSVRRIL